MFSEEKALMKLGSVDELGPIDYLVVEFPRERANFSGEVKEELAALIESGQIGFSTCSS